MTTQTQTLAYCYDGLSRGLKLLSVEECFFFSLSLSQTVGPQAVKFGPQTAAGSNKARSSCQRGGVKEVVGVACEPPNCSPSMLPSYSWNVSPHCATQSHFHRGAAAEICVCGGGVPLVPRCNFQYLKPKSLLAIGKSTLLRGSWLTFVALVILVCALGLQRPCVIVAVNVFLLLGYFSICKRDAGYAATQQFLLSIRGDYLERF